MEDNTKMEDNYRDVYDKIVRQLNIRFHVLEHFIEYSCHYNSPLAYMLLNKTYDSPCYTKIMNKFNTGMYHQM